MAQMVYWIDDSVKKLHYIMQGIIADLWDLETGVNKVVSKILLFGNEYQESPTESFDTIEKEYELFKRLDRVFYDACDSKKDVTWENEIYEANRYLIQNSVKALFKQWTEQEAVGLNTDERNAAYQKNQQLLSFFEEIQKYWRTENRDTMQMDVWQKEASEKVTKLIELMNLEPGACVGIDLALLKNDRISILTSDKTVIAMELYHQLSKEHFCFLYSTYSYEKNLVPKCKEIYKKHYNEDCIIYRRGELMEKKNNNLIKQRIATA